MKTLDFEIDLVYLWVDGRDSNWMKKRNETVGKIVYDNEIDTNCKGRFVESEELKYSLRSVEKHIPWIRNIFIVTNNQKPQWLNTAHPKIKLINQNDILPIEAIPCYNPNIIEWSLYRIPNLSEYFLYGNDDMFFNKDLNKNFFYTHDGLPIVRLKKKPLGKWRYRGKEFLGKKLGQYRQAILNVALMVEKKTGVFFSGISHHNMDAYRKSFCKEIAEHVFEKELKKSFSNKVRSINDLHRSAFDYYALATKRAHLKNIDQYESLRILINQRALKEKIQKYNPSLFCLNDGENVTDEDRKILGAFLEHYFPKKSEFES